MAVHHQVWHEYPILDTQAVFSCSWGNLDLPCTLLTPSKLIHWFLFKVHCRCYALDFRLPFILCFNERKTLNIEIEIVISRWSYVHITNAVCGMILFRLDASVCDQTVKMLLSLMFKLWSQLFIIKIREWWDKLYWRYGYFHWLPAHPNDNSVCLHLLWVALTSIGPLLIPCKSTSSAKPSVSSIYKRPVRSSTW